MNDKRNRDDDDNEKQDDSIRIDLGGLFGRDLGTIASRLNDLMDEVENQFSGEREFSSKDGRIRGSVTFNARTLDEDLRQRGIPRSRPAQRRTPQQRPAPKPEPTTPFVDVMVEDDHTLVLIEVTTDGIDALKIYFDANRLTITEGNQVVCDMEVQAQQITDTTLNNGILQVILQ